MINNNTYIVFDFETGCTKTESTEVLQIAALAIHPRTLEVIPNSEFSCYLHPKSWDNVQAEALKVNNITKEIIEKEGIQLKEGWKAFTDYLQSWNYKKNAWGAPIACGQNIRGFDLPIFNRICKEMNSPSNLFFSRNSIDILDLSFFWFENASEPAKYNLDTLRDFFGIARDGAHNAIVDVRHCAMIISRFLKFHRKLGGVEKFKGAFSK